jgi:hypothetical protein
MAVFRLNIRITENQITPVKVGGVNLENPVPDDGYSGIQVNSFQIEGVESERFLQSNLLSVVEKKP